MPEFSNFLLPAALATIMLGIGLDITFGDFRRVFTRPRAVFTGLACQMILLPVVAFLIAFLAPIAPGYKAGLILVACCPGGTSSNLVTHLLKGRVALSVTLTALNSFLIIFTIPAIFGLALDLFLGTSGTITLSLADTMRDIGLTVILPVVCGILVKNRWPVFAGRLKNPLRYVLPALLILVFTYLIFFDEGSAYDVVLMDNLILLIPAFALNLTAMLAGYYASGLASVKHDGRYTIAIEVGLQNSALAIYIGEQLLSNTEIVTIALIYGGFSFFTTLGIGYLMRELGGRS